MKIAIQFLFLLLTLGSCKETDGTPQLVGIWETVPSNTSDLSIYRIEFRKDGTLAFESDCYCSKTNSYQVLGNNIKIGFGKATCLPIVDCARPSSAVIVELSNEVLVIDWIFEPNYPKSNNFQRRYRRL